MNLESSLESKIVKRKEKGLLGRISSSVKRKLLPFAFALGSGLFYGCGGGGGGSNPIPNEPPVLDYITTPQNVDEGQNISFQLTATDLDNDPITYSANNLPQNATLNPTTGLFSWTPNSTQGDTGGRDYVITFKASDGKAFDSQDVVIHV
ncbi:MAG: Ig domain-containing protein, partial [Candidatus Pacearchaeota archaeon]